MEGRDKRGEKEQTGGGWKERQRRRRRRKSRLSSDIISGVCGWKEAKEDWKESRRTVRRKDGRMDRATKDKPVLRPLKPTPTHTHTHLSYNIHL